MRSLSEPILMGRSFLAWMNFLMIIPLLMVALIEDTRWLLMLQMFWAGCLFMMWLLDRRYLFWVNEVIKMSEMNVELLEMLKQRTGGKNAKK